MDDTEEWDKTRRYHEDVKDMLAMLIDRYGGMKLNAAILLDDVRRRCERLYETEHRTRLE